MIILAREEDERISEIPGPRDHKHDCVSHKGLREKRQPEAENRVRLYTQREGTGPRGVKSCSLHPPPASSFRSSDDSSLYPNQLQTSQKLW